MSAVLDPDGYPILLPHVALHNGCIHTGLTDKTPVGYNEGRFIEACDGLTSFADIAAYAPVSPSFVASIVNWLIWWPIAVPTSDRSTQGEVARLVLAAAPESPWLGMGGQLLCEASSIPTLILNCFQPLANSFGAGETKSEAQLAAVDEAAFAARLAGVAFDQMWLPSAADRLQTNQDDEMIIAVLRTRILETVVASGAGEIFVPAALSANEDALLLFDIVLALVAEGLLTCRVRLYEDVPATFGERRVDELLGRFENGFLELSDEFMTIGDWGDRKEALLRGFKFGVDAGRRRRWREGAALNAGRFCPDAAAPIERLWDVKFAELG